MGENRSTTFENPILDANEENSIHIVSCGLPSRIDFNIGTLLIDLVQTLMS